MERTNRSVHDTRLFIAVDVEDARTLIWDTSFETVLQAMYCRMNMEDMFLIEPNIDDKLETLADFLRFFWDMKVFVALYCLYVRMNNN